MSKLDEIHTYQPLNGDDEQVEAWTKPSFIGTLASRLGPIIGVLIVIVAFVATAVAGFTAGRLYPLDVSAPSYEIDPKPILELDHIKVKFKSNRTYLERPSPANDKLWEALYPKDHHGLFEWPDENPERAGFAGFHQLHCVVSCHK